MPSRYEVWLADDQGEQIALLDHNSGFRYTRVVNAIGKFSVALPASFDRSLIRKDRQVQIWRAGDDGQSLGLDFVGFVRAWSFDTDRDGRLTVNIGGPCLNDLLRRRVVGSVLPYVSEFSDYADDAMKDIVEDSMGADASSDRDLTAYGFSVQGQSSSGPTVYLVDVSWRTALTMCTLLAEQAETEGTSVFFDVVADGPQSFVFRTWTGQRGQDRTVGGADGPSCVFGLEFGNLEEPRYSVDCSKEINFVYGLGPGEGENLNMQSYEDTERTAASVWARCEGYVNAGNAATDDGVTAAAKQAAAEGKPRHRFEGRLLDTELTKYGRDWGIGDRVTASYLGQQFDGIVRVVDVRMDESGSETIEGRMEVIL